MGEMVCLRWVMMMKIKCIGGIWFWPCAFCFFTFCLIVFEKALVETWHLGDSDVTVAWQWRGSWPEING